MALINRGRLSVQRVEEDVWVAVEKLANSGGWEVGVKPTKKPRRAGGGSKKPSRAETSDEDVGEDDTIENAPKPKGRKRKIEDIELTDAPTKRRSTRLQQIS